MSERKRLLVELKIAGRRVTHGQEERESERREVTRWFKFVH